VTTPSQVLFTSNGQSSLSVAIPIDSAAYTVQAASFQVSNRRNVALQPTISNDPFNLFEASYDNGTDSFIVWLSAAPLPQATAGLYSILTIAVPDSLGQTVYGYLNVSFTAPVVLIFGPGIGINDASKAGSSVAGSTLAGIVVGVVVGLVVLTLLLAAVILRRRKRALDTKIANEPFYSQVGGLSSSLDNPTYLQQVAVSDLGFEPGIQNPMYAWYRPDLSRQECEEFLADQVDGAFVIRDSAATPGWHMLAVKTHNAIVHEKIKMSDDGLYELLPATVNGQPKFKEMPMLVEHYAEHQDGIRYTLALDNPLYDNSQLAYKKSGHAVAGAWSYQADADAPSVPLKERERAVVQQVAQAAEESGDEIYTNTEQAKTVISSA